LPSRLLIASTWALYGETTPMLSPWPVLLQAAEKTIVLLILRGKAMERIFFQHI
jgi:hypothetical protein